MKLSLISAFGLLILCSVQSSAVSFTFASSTFTSFDYPGAITTYAEDVNDSGQIAGYYVGSAPGSFSFTHGFLKDGADFISIDYPGATSTYVFGINASGQIVGSYSDASTSHGFLKDGANFVSIDYPGASSTYATGINDISQVVGYYFGSVPGNSSGVHGFLKDGANLVSFDDPTANDYTVPAGINNSGQIVGTHPFLGHGFLKDGVSFIAIDYPGATRTSADGINDNGQFVGAYFDNSTTHGFLKDGANYMPVDYPGAMYTLTTGINDRGEIVGYATLANVPEPSTLALLAMGALLFGCCNKALKEFRNPIARL